MTEPIPVTPVERSQQRLERLRRVRDSEEDRTRRADAALRLRYYHGESEGLVERMPHEDDDSWRVRPKFVPNILAHALGELSRLWAECPTRSVESETQRPADAESEPGETAEDAAEGRWRDVLWTYGTGLDGTMREAQPLARLLGAMHVLVQYTPSLSAPRDPAAVLAGVEPELDEDEARPGLELVPILPDRTVVLPHDHDPRHALAVMYLARQYIRTGDGVTGSTTRTVTVWHYWDAEHWAVLEDDGTSTGSLRAVPQENPDTGEMIEWHPHPYGRIPVVPLRWHTPSDRYWPAPLGGADLLENLRAVASLWSQYLWTAMLQRGQPAADEDVQGNGGLAPDSIIVAPGFRIVPNAADLTGMRDALQTTLGILSRTLGLPSRSLRLDDSGGQSGVGIAMDRAELEDDRQASEVVGKGWERSIHRIGSRVWAPHTGERLPPRVETEFAPFSIPLTADQRVARVTLELDRGLMSRLEAKLELHPGMAVERAEELLAAVDDEQQEARQRAAEDADAQAERQARVAAAAAPPDPFAGLFAQQPSPAAAQE